MRASERERNTGKLRGRSRRPIFVISHRRARRAAREHPLAKGVIKMQLERTYQIERAPEPSMAWDNYERIVLAEWRDILDRHDVSEGVVQTFLEKHPCMVPGALQVSGSQSGHYPWLCSLISQPPLPSYDRRFPDFMWIAVNSDTEAPLLIEIESPTKRWFTSSGTQTSHLTQALDQIVQWKAWFSIPHNVEAFKAFYGLNREAWYRRRFRPAYMLIYGRRKEANASPQSIQKRGFLVGDPDVSIITYDRLRPDRNCDQTVCVKATADQSFVVKSVPPTLEWSPALAKERASLQAFPVAINANKYISPARKAFLIRRCEYWNEWGKREQPGVIHGSDKE